MVDFRYHALSLVAVFLALGIGILLGATIGDSIVTEADRNLRSSLRRDVVDARGDARRAGEGLRGRDRLIDAVLPQLAAGRLANRRFVLVASGRLPDDVDSSVREAVEAAGGELDSTAVLAVPGELDELGSTVGGAFSRVEETDDGDLVERLGRRIGRSLARGDAAARRLEEERSERFRGDFEGADGVVLYRSPPDTQADQDGEDRARTRARRAFEEGLVEGLKAGGNPVVGVEESSTDPSQIRFFEDRDLSTIDNVDGPGGRLALVLVLDGAEGSFGYKETAEAPLPEAPER